MGVAERFLDWIGSKVPDEEYPDSENGMAIMEVIAYMFGGK